VPEAVLGAEGRGPVVPVGEGPLPPAGPPVDAVVPPACPDEVELTRWDCEDVEVQVMVTKVVPIEEDGVVEGDILVEFDPK
jgi:hypothetical protein